MGRCSGIDRAVRVDRGLSRTCAAGLTGSLDAALRCQSLGWAPRVSSLASPVARGPGFLRSRLVDGDCFEVDLEREF